MAEPRKVEVEALEVLRGEDGKLVQVGKTTEVSKEAADILVANKQAKLVVQAKV
ncbi:hypothetical protein [Sulfurimonas sp.]